MIPWIIGLCVAATLAVMGWTMTATLAARIRAFEGMKETGVSLQAQQSATQTRVAVLENKYDTIQAALAEIKALLLGHMGKYHERT